MRCYDENNEYICDDVTRGQPRTRNHSGRR